MSLRAWLKKEEVFDVEIESCLAELNVEDEETLLRGNLEISFEGKLF